MNIEPLRKQLQTLKLTTAKQELEEVITKHSKAVDLTWLSDLLEREIDARKERALASRIKKAAFPEITTLETFDWEFNPKIDKKKIKDLATLDFIKQNQISLFLGQPGTGKTHIALAIGVLAATRGFRVYCTSLKKLNADILMAKQKTHCMSYLKKYYQPNYGFLMTGESQQ